MELDLDEWLVRAVTAVHPGNPLIEAVKQLWQPFKATGQVWQVVVIGIFHTHRLPAAIVVNRSLVNPSRQPPEPLAKTAEFTRQRQPRPFTQVKTGVDP